MRQVDVAGIHDALEHYISALRVMMVPTPSGDAKIIHNPIKAAIVRAAREQLQRRIREADETFTVYHAKRLRTPEAHVEVEHITHPAAAHLVRVGIALAGIEQGGAVVKSQYIAALISALAGLAKLAGKELAIEVSAGNDSGGQGKARNTLKFSAEELREAFRIEQSALRNLAKKADVPTAGRGGKNYRYPLAHALKMAEIESKSGRSEDSKKGARSFINANRRR